VYSNIALFSPKEVRAIIKYTVVLKDGVPYEVPVLDEETTYYAQKENDPTVYALKIIVRQCVVDWAPNDMVRMEGFMITKEGNLKTIAQYRLHSTELPVGILEVQDA
jgi:hypothetical protein